MFKRKTLYYLILISINIVVFEVSSYWICREYLAPRGIVYYPLEVGEKEFLDYQKRRHIELGWLQGVTQIKEVDKIGSRIIPSFPNPELYPSCVSVYGDSYTWSNRVEATKAWANQLSFILGCRVSNFGVSGYGTDQALLRYLYNVQDTSQIVVLNHFVFDVMRNVNQYWGFRAVSNKHKFMFKPRFILDENNQLEQISLPAFKLTDYNSFIENPNSYLKHEYFLPAESSGLERLEFPYSYTFIRSLLFHPKFKTIFKGEPAHLAFYRPNHPSNSLNITAAIMIQFCKTAIDREQFPLLTIIPYLNDFQYFNKSGKWAYQSLIDQLHRNGVQVLNIGKEMMKLEETQDYKIYFAGEGHFNAKGDSIMAGILARHIKEIGLK